MSPPELASGEFISPHLAGDSSEALLPDRRRGLSTRERAGPHNHRSSSEASGDVPKCRSNRSGVPKGVGGAREHNHATQTHRSGLRRSLSSNRRRNFVGCETDKDSDSSPAPTGPATAEEQAGEQKESPQGGREQPKADERSDLISFKVDDRSQAGITMIWVTWTIKNNSSEKSNYSWDWEAVDPSGKRVGNSTELVTDVQPGQTATGESPTVIDDADVKLNITEFDRTKAH
ncbi:hypothetical protein WB401_16090 [Streptomyces brasiliscabiei]|uniref:Uncharacterized protein n=1 Tax=Streptomyces brasiliscabiei TaxID=2736302 RepID=A0ABU8GJ02_9ACTN